jgi:trypsin
MKLTLLFAVVATATAAAAPITADATAPITADAAAPKTFQCFEGKDFRFHGDIANVTGGTPEICQQACAEVPACNAVAVALFDGNCYLKALTQESQTQMIDKADVITCVDSAIAGGGKAAKESLRRAADTEPSSIQSKKGITMSKTKQPTTKKPAYAKEGKVVPVGRHRYIAGLLDLESSTGVDGELISCAGSLIAPNVVLTAAHCTNKDLKSVLVGSSMPRVRTKTRLLVKPVIRNVLQQIRHPKYDAKTKANDVAVLILDREITAIKPVAVSFEPVPAGENTWLRGWGTKKGHNRFSLRLMEVSVRTWDNKAASAALKPWKMDNTMLAAGGVKGKDSCRGDEGGPLTIEENGVARLVGVVSWGLSCDGETPGVYSRLSTAREFIERYLKSPAKAKRKANPAPKKRVQKKKSRVLGEEVAVENSEDAAVIDSDVELALDGEN